MENGKEKNQPVDFSKKNAGSPVVTVIVVICIAFALMLPKIKDFMNSGTAEEDSRLQEMRKEAATSSGEARKDYNNQSLITGTATHIIEGDEYAYSLELPSTFLEQQVSESMMFYDGQFENVDAAPYVIYSNYNYTDVETTKTNDIADFSGKEGINITAIPSDISSASEGIALVEFDFEGQNDIVAYIKYSPNSSVIVVLSARNKKDVEANKDLFYKTVKSFKIIR